MGHFSVVFAAFVCVAGVGVLSSPRGAGTTTHPELCLSCRALFRAPAETHQAVCETAANELLGFTQEHCMWLSGQVQTHGAEEGATVDQTCGKIHSDCSGATGAPLAGASQCTWGPSFWCDKHINAMSCDSAAWCQEKQQGFAAAHEDTCLLCRALHNTLSQAGDLASVCATATQDIPDLPQGHCEWLGGRVQEMLLGEETDAEAACARVHPQCQPSGLLGSNKCTWGPGFWCARTINSIACQTESQCTEA